MERRANVWRLLEKINFFFFFFFVIYSILVQGTLPKEDTFGILKRGEFRRILHIFFNRSNFLYLCNNSRSIRLRIFYSSF